LFLEGDKAFSALKVLRQYPLVLPVQVRLREDTALGSEESEVLGSGFSCEQKKELSWGSLLMIGMLILTLKGWRRVTL
jgi:hypothetical protein